jgi:hypothetical protein
MVIKFADYIPEEMIEITIQENKPPPPGPPQQTTIIQIVGDNIENKDNFKIDVEADQSTEIQNYQS